MTDKGGYMNKNLNEVINAIPVVILAGGTGTNVGSDKFIPKPMVEINGVPLLLHILDHYGKFGFNKFIICAGYHSELIKEFVGRVHLFGTQLNVRYTDDAIPKYSTTPYPDTIDRKNWDITVIDTGINNLTGSRVAQVRHLVNYSPMFCLTYGDTISDINIHDLISFHLSHKKNASLVAVNLPIRFRILGLYGDSDLIRGFAEKPVLQKDFINGGFYVFNNSIFNLKSLRTDPECTLETDVLEELVANKELYSFKHAGFWQHIDTERDRQKVSLWLSKRL
jgi:glucose-1-phosphate cytidylyltransferase